MRPEALILYATNTGSLYEIHKDLGRHRASHSTWRYHVANNILEAYRREFREPFEGMSRADIDEAAQKLAAYYVEHVTEEGA